MAKSMCIFSERSNFGLLKTQPHKDTNFFMETFFWNSAHIPAFLSTLVRMHWYFCWLMFHYEVQGSAMLTSALMFLNYCTCLSFPCSIGPVTQHFRFARPWPSPGEVLGIDQTYLLHHGVSFLSDVGAAGWGQGQRCLTWPLLTQCSPQGPVSPPWHSLEGGWVFVCQKK